MELRELQSRFRLGADICSLLVQLHRDLTCKQFEFGSDSTGRFLRFKDRKAKNAQGGLKDRKVLREDLRIYASPALEDRCVVDLFSHYRAFVPKTGPFIENRSVTIHQSSASR